MKKPEKKFSHPENSEPYQKEIGFNQACDVWEKYHKWKIHDTLKRIDKEVDALKRRLAK